MSIARIIKVILSHPVALFGGTGGRWCSGHSGGRSGKEKRFCTSIIVAALFGEDYILVIVAIMVVIFEGVGWVKSLRSTLEFFHTCN